MLVDRFLWLPYRVPLLFSLQVIDSEVCLKSIAFCSFEYICRWYKINSGVIAVCVVMGLVTVALKRKILRYVYSCVLNDLSCTSFTLLKMSGSYILFHYMDVVDRYIEKKFDFSLQGHFFSLIVN